MGVTTVIAIGGHSLVEPSLSPSIENQFAVTARAMVPVADFIEASATDDRIVLTHGNGPQVGFKALRSELSRDHLHEVPLDSIVADTQGSIGYMIQRALREELRQRSLPFTVAAVVTEIEVDPEDQAFEEPTKPIGRFYSRDEQDELRRHRDWDLVEDPTRGWRRVVPSPAPVRILQIDQIRQLTDWGAIVVACGGGGIPIMRGPDGALRGVEGVIDKDRSSALLGVRLGARSLVITTSVDGVYRDFGTPRQELLRELSVSQLLELAGAGQFPPGSMGPKVKAAERFLRHGGEDVIICRPEDLLPACRGERGTRIVRD